MNIGKTLFAQLMDFLPWSTFARIVARYGGDARVRTLCCAEQYRAHRYSSVREEGYDRGKRWLQIAIGIPSPPENANGGDGKPRVCRGVEQPEARRKGAYPLAPFGLINTHEWSTTAIAIFWTLSPRPAAMFDFWLPHTSP